MPPVKKTLSKSNLDFESSLEKIESLVDVLEHDSTSLEESLSAFEKGIILTKSAQKALASAEQKVHVLLEDDSEPVVQDFSEEDANL